MARVWVYILLLYIGMLFIASYFHEQKSQTVYQQVAGHGEPTALFKVRS
jgi:CHASE3 domain sensor protein